MLTFNPSKNDTSIALDLLRAVAAQMVCVGHAMLFFGVGDWLKPPFVPWMQNIGVLLFLRHIRLLDNGDAAAEFEKSRVWV